MNRRNIFIDILLILMMAFGIYHSASISDRVASLEDNQKVLKANQKETSDRVDYTVAQCKKINVSH